MNNSTSKDGSVRLRSSYLSSVISISLVLFLLGLLGLLVIDARKISDYVKEHISVNLFLHDHVSVAEAAKFQAKLEKEDFVRTSKYISKEDALDSLKKELGEDALGMLEANPLPATIDIRIQASYAHPDSLKKIKEQLSGNKLIREVTYMQTQVDKMNENFRTVAMIILIFCALLFFIAVALINNTIRLSMYSRRFLIKSMQLVGATKGFIRLPFLKKGIGHGFSAGIVACVLLSGIIYLIHTRFPELGQLSDLKMLGILFSGVLLAGILISIISTFFAVNRYLRMKMDDLY